MQEARSTVWFVYNVDRPSPKGQPRRFLGVKWARICPSGGPLGDTETWQERLMGPCTPIAPSTRTAARTAALAVLATLALTSYAALED